MLWTREEIAKLKREDAVDKEVRLVEVLSKLIEVLSRLETVLAQLTERVGRY
jgi:hypothetical protein